MILRQCSKKKVYVIEKTRLCTLSLNFMKNIFFRNLGYNAFAMFPAESLGVFPNIMYL